MIVLLLVEIGKFLKEGDTKIWFDRFFDEPEGGHSEDSTKKYPILTINLGGDEK